MRKMALCVSHYDCSLRQTVLGLRASTWGNDRRKRLRAPSTNSQEHPTLMRLLKVSVLVSCVMIKGGVEPRKTPGTRKGKIGKHTTNYVWNRKFLKLENSNAALGQHFAQEKKTERGKKKKVLSLNPEPVHFSDIWYHPPRGNPWSDHPAA